jgi:hypothetical protein
MSLQVSGDKFAEEGNTAKPNSSQSASSNPSSSQSKPSGKITLKREEINSYLKEVLLAVTLLVTIFRVLALFVCLYGVRSSKIKSVSPFEKHCCAIEEFMMKRKLLVRLYTEFTYQPSCYKICIPEEAELYDNSVVSRKSTGVCKDAAMQCSPENLDKI